MAEALLAVLHGIECIGHMMVPPSEDVLPVFVSGSCDVA